MPYLDNLTSMTELIQMLIMLINKWFKDIYISRVFEVVWYFNFYFILQEHSSADYSVYVLEYQDFHKKMEWNHV